jgi:hypothetical protein
MLETKLRYMRSVGHPSCANQCDSTTICRSKSLAWRAVTLIRLPRAFRAHDQTAWCTDAIRRGRPGRRIRDAQRRFASVSRPPAEERGPGCETCTGRPDLGGFYTIKDIRCRPQTSSRTGYTNLPRVTSPWCTCAAGPTKQVCQTQASSRPPGTLSLRWAESGTQAVGAKSPRKRWQRRARRASAQLLRQHCPECASDVRLLPSGGYSADTPTQLSFTLGPVFRALLSQFSLLRLGTRASATVVRQIVFGNRRRTGPYARTPNGR